MKAVSTALLAMAIMASGATPLLAQGSHGASMPGLDMKNMGPLQKGSMEAMEKMNKAMMQGMMDPDPDLAWMKGMAAHHQGAVDMSEAAIKHSKDETVVKEARKTKDENEKSLREIQAKILKDK